MPHRAPSRMVAYGASLKIAVAKSSRGRFGENHEAPLLRRELHSERMLLESHRMFYTSYRRELRVWRRPSIAAGEAQRKE